MNSWRRLLCAGLAVVLPAPVLAVEEAPFAVNNVWFDKKGSGYAVRADLQVGQQPLLEKILHGGEQVELNFELNFHHRRNWLLDPVVGSINWRGVLSYDSLTRRYLLASGGRQRQFAALDAAVEEINRLRAGASSDSEYVKILVRNDVYLQARFYMSVSNLPAIMQIGLLIAGELQQGEWVTFPLEVRE